MSREGIKESDGTIEAEWSVGDLILDIYEVTGILGEGTTSRVYKVRHKIWDIDLAVKTLKPGIRLRMAIRPAEQIADLEQHPHIVSCHYMRELGGVLLFFTEYVGGGTLSDWINDGRLYEGGSLSESSFLASVRSSVFKFAQEIFSQSSSHSRDQKDSEDALERILDVAIQLAWGLHFAHEQGLVHQDVKPGNVMMTPDGTAKLKDLNLPVDMSGLTEAYCSPEQMNGEPVSLRTDIWSWGLTILEMFTGIRTWRYGSEAARALDEYLKTGSGNPIISRMPVAVAKLLKSCFKKDPEQRPRDMIEIACTLQRIYSRIRGRIYARQIPDANKLLADSLNNRALSYLDLGRTVEAEAVWKATMEADPGHLDANYNYGLTLWRRGELTDKEVVERLSEARFTNSIEGWRVKYLLMLIHLERGDIDSARSMLKQANSQAPGGSEMAAGFMHVWLREDLRSGPLQMIGGHKDSVNCVCFSPDGHSALSGSSDKTLCLWEVATGQSLQIFKGHTGPVTSMAFSEDGRYLLSGSWDRTLRFWEVATGRCLQVFEGHDDLINSVWLSADGTYALSGSGSLKKTDNSVRLWDTSSSRSLQIFEGHTDSVNSICSSGNGRYVLSGSSDNSLRLWEATTGLCLRLFEEHTDSVNSICLSADGRHVLSGSSDHTLRLWEVATGRCLRVFRGHSNSVFSVSLSADGKFAISGGLDGTLRVWEVTTGRCLRTFEEQKEPFNSVSLSADGCSALSGGGIFGSDKDSSLRVWGFHFDNVRICPLRVSISRSFSELSQIELQAKDLLKRGERALDKAQYSTALELIKRARELPGCERIREGLDAWTRMANCSKRVGLRAVWPVRNFEGHSELLHSVCLSRGGRFALSGSRDRTVRLWEVATGRCLQILRGHTDDVGSVCFSSDTKYALSGSDDDTLRLWEVANGRCLQIFRGHVDDVNSVCLNHDRKFALSGSHDRTVRLWETGTGRLLRIFEGHTDSIFTVSLSADGQFALSGGRDRTLRLWEVATGRCLRIFKGHAGPVSSAKLSNDGRVVLSGSFDKTLRLWNTETGVCLQVYEGHTDAVYAVFMSADSLFAISGGPDETLRFWDLASGRCLHTSEGQNGKVLSVGMSQDGRYAVSGGYGKTLKLWELDWELEACKQSNWEDGARSYLEVFLNQHRPYARELPGQNGSDPGLLREEEIRMALTRLGRPTWSNQDFQEFLWQLSCAGYGWLQSEGVRSELEKMAKS